MTQENVPLYIYIVKSQDILGIIVRGILLFIFMLTIVLTVLRQVTEAKL